MSKSRGNYIGVAEPPEQQYGKIMSIPDSLILQYFELLTNIPADELAGFKQALASNAVNPMELKKRLARDIVTQLNGEQAASEAEEHFKRTVQNKEIPEERAKARSGRLLDMLVEAGVVKSRSEARRLITQGAVNVDGKKATDANQVVPPNSIIKAGKRDYIQST